MNVDPIPKHLAQFKWYAPHLAWLSFMGFTRVMFNTGTAKPRRADLSGSVLSGCNLCGAFMPLVEMRGTVLRRANLYAAVMDGATMRACDCSDAMMSHAKLRGVNGRHAWFGGAELRGSDMTHADLTGATMQGAGLRGTNMYEATLEHAQGLPDAPTVPNIDRKILALLSDGTCVLDRNGWTACNRLQSRAMLAIRVAGEDGLKLLANTSPYLAARLIYEASRPGVPCPDFLGPNDEVMADIERCAATYTAAGGVA